MKLKQNDRLFSWIAGSSSVFAAGFFQIPDNLQATIVYSATVTVLWLRVHRLRGLTAGSAIELLAAFFLCSFFSFTTNRLLVLALHLTAFYWMVDLLLRGSGFPVRTLREFVFGAAFLLLGAFKRLFSRSGLRDFVSPADGTGTLGARFSIAAFSLIAGMSLFYLFHLLFSHVNEEYRRVMTPVIEWLWVAFIKNILFSMIHSYIAYGLLTCNQTHVPGASRSFPGMTAAAMLAGSGTVTAAFAFFQMRLVFGQMDMRTFHELSRYTQKGFIQLIVAAILGYVVVLIAFDSAQRAKGSKAIMIGAALLILEMLAVTGFSAHKLALLQISFGLKDQRILASCGIAFIVFSFALIGWKAVLPRTTSSAFRMQAGFLLFVVLALNVVNLDQVVSRHFPIRYYIGNRPYSDYSYLLGNSYDNVDEWPRIMEEMIRVRPPHPNRGYFWGYESPDHRDAFRFEYNPLCAQRPVLRRVEEADGPVLMPTPLIERAFARYGHPRPVIPASPTNGVRGTNSNSARSAQEDDAEERLAFDPTTAFNLSRLLNFNLREYRAYKYAKTHPLELARFDQFMRHYCAETP